MRKSRTTWSAWLQKVPDISFKIADLYDHAVNWSTRIVNNMRAWLAKRQPKALRQSKNNLATPTPQQATQSNVSTNKAFLQSATDGDNASMLKAWTNTACDDNPTDAHGNTALMLAAKHQHEHCVTPLVSIIPLDATNQGGDTALVLAVRAGSVAITSKLLEQQANIAMKNHDDKTAWEIAVANKNLRIIELFIKDKRLIAHAIKTGNTTLLAQLIEYGADSNTQDDDGNTLLMLAYQAKQLGACHALLEKGADIKRCNRQDQNIFHWIALQTQDPENNQDKLIQAYVLPNIIKHNPNVAKLNPDQSDANGQTPLMIACQRGNATLANWLFETFGADPSITDKNGLSAIDYAKKNGITLFDTPKPSTPHKNIDLPRQVNHSNQAQTIHTSVKHNDEQPKVSPSDEIAAAEPKANAPEANNTSTDTQNRPTKTDPDEWHTQHHGAMNPKDTTDDQPKKPKAKQKRKRKKIHANKQETQALEMIQRIENNRILTGKTTAGDTALMLAVKADDANKTAELIEQGEHALSLNLDGDMAPTLAKTETVRKCFDAIEITAKQKNRALREAAAKGNVRSVKYLLDIGANPMEKDKYGFNACMHASSQSHLAATIAIVTNDNITAKMQKALVTATTTANKNARDLCPRSNKTLDHLLERCGAIYNKSKTKRKVIDITTLPMTVKAQTTEPKDHMDQQSNQENNHDRRFGR